MSTVTCYCGAPGVLRESRWGKFWGCDRWPECDGTVGCHPGTSTPLGTMADKVTRSARIQAHDAFDALWEPLGKPYRKHAYRMLGEEFGIDEPHIGEMDAEMCERVVEWAQAMGPEDVEEYVHSGEATP
jgi:ssDNA-binding Zn-finger/Zn-ribbon topoisomerase 1